MLVARGKGQAIGQLSLHPIDGGVREIAIGLLETRFELQTANAEEPFVVSRPVESRADFELAALGKRTPKNNIS